MPIHRAPSFDGPWEYEGYVLPQCSSIQLAGNCDVWAPDVHPIGDIYYLYYGVSTIASQASAIGLATSTSLEAGSWTDHGMIFQSKPGDPYNAIDPSLLITDDDKHLLTFGSYFNGIYQVQVPSDTDPVDMDDASISHLAALTDTFVPYIEGAFLYRRGQFYYLFFSSGICCAHNFLMPPPGQEYKIKVCRSKSPNKGFVDQDGVDCLNDNGGTEILGSHDDVYSPGGQGVYDVPNLGPILYYHFANLDVGMANDQKVLGMNWLDFSSGWPVVTETLPLQDGPVGNSTSPTSSGTPRPTSSALQGPLSNPNLIISIIIICASLQVILHLIST